MHPGRRGALAILLLLAAAMAVSLPARADANPPVIEAVWWEPRNPIHPDNITVYARISDADPLQFVETTFCYVPPFLCLYQGMSDPDEDGVWSVVPRGPGSTSTQPAAKAEGASIAISAVDTFNNAALSDKLYVLFVDSLNLSLATPVVEVEPGQPFTVDGVALYEGNASAPAEGITATVGIPGNTGQDVVDANGSFSVTLMAPNTEGTWPITAIASDRSLMDTEQATLAVATTPRPDLTVSDIRVSPLIVVAGTVSVAFHAYNVGTLAVTDVRVLVEVVGSSTTTILDDRFSIPPRGGDIPLVASWTAPRGSVTIQISIDPDGEVDELNETNNEIGYSLMVQAPPPPEIPAIVWIVAGAGLIAAAAVLGFVVLRRKHGVMSPKIVAGAAFVIAVVLVVAGLIAVVGAPAPPPEPAPAFSLTDIDGNAVNTTSLRGNVTLLEFSGTWCAPCRIVEAGLKELYPAYNGTVTFLSVFIGQNNDNGSIVVHRDRYNIPWRLATAPPGMTIDFGVAAIPRVLVIDREGYVTRDWEPSPGFSKETVKQSMVPALDEALTGEATAISVSSLGVPALMVLAALLSFFSPCSFPVLPAFMAYYLNLDAKGTKAGPKVAAGRGFLASLGMVTVYGIIALVVLAAGLAARNLQYISPIIGVILIAAAVLSLLPFQYHYLTRPFIALKQMIAARMGGRWTPGMGAKLFAFGAGYAAAGFACVAPPLIGAMSAASAVGQPGQAVLGLVLYIVIVVSLMMAVTVALTVAGDRAIKKVRVWSGAMKYISAAALLIAGSYLLWLFYVSNVG